jgi:hypothetical protein
VCESACVGVVVDSCAVFFVYLVYSLPRHVGKKITRAFEGEQVRSK